MKEISEITQWLGTLLSVEKIALSDSWQVLPLPGDASVRKYYRLTSNEKNFIIASTPVDVIDNAIFINISEQWGSKGISVPKVFAFDETKGFMLIEDLGEHHLFDSIEVAISSGLYKKAIEHLLLIQKLNDQKLPMFDRNFLLREMMLFKTWFIEYQLGLTAPDFLEDCFEFLIKSALIQPQVVMHRDYHSKNLLIIEDDIGVIDFQDAVQGPIAYDLVSLLKDCYVSLTDYEIDDLVDFYVSKLNASKVLSFEVAQSEFRQWFDLIGLQRHLKVLGLFIKLSVEQNKTGYLYELPRVYNYVLTVSSQYKELSPLYEWLKKTVNPLLIDQPWYSH